MEGKRLEGEQPEAETLLRTFADHAPAAHGAGDLARKRRDLLKRYGVALGLAGLALFLRGVLPFREGTAVYQLPLVAVLLSAWYGGRGPGLLASVICITGVSYWFVPPVRSFETSPDHVLPLSIFIALCLLVTYFSAGRRRVEQALRASEERFRALVQFSFDVYWETDAQHRFTRQEFSERLTDAPARGSEIGKTRWEIPYLEPDEEAWRRHRATLDAHLPFRDFELARPAADGGMRYVSVSGMPAFDESGKFIGYRGVGRHITDRKLAEAEHRAHVWFLESMDRINRAMQATNDVEKMMGDVLDAVLEIFASDRAWLLYPCDPDAPSWRPVMERTRPEFPGAGSRGGDLPMTLESAAVVRAALGSARALLRGGSHGLQPSRDIAEQFGVRSDMLMALHPKGDRPYLFGLHQCSRVRSWTTEEQRLFEEIGHRLADALGSLITFRSLRESEQRFRALVQFSFDVWYWETDEQHRFTRQELSEQAGDAPPFPVAEIGKTRWEHPSVDLGEEGWRQHRATVEAHLPFRDFERAIPTADGGKRYHSVSGLPVFDETGRFAGYRGVGRDITERKRAEAERRAHVWFLESLDRINRAVQATYDLDRVLSDVLEAVLEIFACDRAWLIYPCDADAPSWRAVMEHTRPEFPGAFALGVGLPIDPETAAVFSAARASPDPIRLGPADELKVPADVAERFAIRSVMAMALHPKGDRPYLFGLHQCTHARTWTDEEQRLFKEIGHRLADALGSLIAVRSLRESERRLEAAQQVAHVGWWERDYATGHVSLSNEAGRIFGVQPVDLPHWDGRWRSLIHPEDRDKAAAASEMALAGGARYDVEYRVVRPDGAVRVVHSQGDVTRDESGRPVRQFGVMQDITELRQAEDELRASQARLEEAQRIAHLGYWERDFVANRVMLAEESWRIFGIPPQERTTDLVQWRERWLALMHPEDRPRVLAAVKAALAGGPRYDVEFRITRADGEERVIHSQGDVIRDASGRSCRMFGTQQDITELRRAEQEARARQDMLDLAQKAARAVAFDWHIGERERENRWSPELEAMYGLEPGTFDRTYQGWKQLVHPDDWPSVKAAIERANRSGEVDAEYRVVHKDGAVRWLQAKGRMFFDAERRPERMVGFMIDVTDRRQAEEELRAAEARFRTFVDHATDAFFLHDEKLQLVDVNHQACRSLGYSREQLVGMHPREFDATLDEAAISRLAERARAGEKLTFETRHRRKDGTLFPVEIRTSTFRQGDKLLYLSLARDISERKLVEEALRNKDYALQSARNELARVSRVTMMGELTAAIAHEVNQPLGAMVANAAACTRWIAGDPPESAKARRALESIAADGRRASEIIGRIRALVKRQAPRKDLVDVNVKAMQVIELAAEEIRRNGIVLRTELADGLPRVEGDRVQLQQVLLNLILNAIDAMSPIRDRARELAIVSRCDGPHAVLIEVRDTGPGLEPQHAERLFEPFYTTKSDGLGIGLSISRSIVEAHGGRLWASPNEPQGAIFRFSLPAGEAAP